MAEKRWCYYVSGMHTPDDGTEGFIPSRVDEDTPGHRLMKGDPKKLQTPWVWGPTLEEAHATADMMNERMGISPEEASEIIASSMRASNIGGSCESD